MAKLLIDMPQIDNPVFCPTICMKTELGARIVCDMFGARLMELPETGINQSIYRCPACLAAERKAKEGK